jgi:hypothetical protein
MDFAVIRNNRQRERLIEAIKERRLPFRIALQDLFPIRSVDFNAYLWGVVYYYIAEATGHTQIEVHEACKVRYNFRHDFKYFKKSGKWKLVSKVDSSTAMFSLEFMEYVMRVRADAEIELHLTIPLPNEEFKPELSFETEL